ncbi:MAG TPA: crosslink repair DNA glycosylase YcaQ family protein [Candidatus Limnocylindria bacterium]|nr:crosslink repair DNA glycosylase YcaQ family protein [Candidatus Limnocylindria bacterium]
MTRDPHSSGAPLRLERAQILAYRRRVQALEERLPPGPESLRQAAWAGLQDSMPRAALLSIHARVDGTRPDALDDPSLVQLWGPRYSTYVVAAADVAPFTLGRLWQDPRRRQRAEDIAARLTAFLDGREMLDRDAGPALGVHPNALRYASPTGTVLVRWDGARAPTVRSVPPPAIDPREARLELARRYLHVFGPTTADAFAEWAGIRPPEGRTAFEALGATLTHVRTPIGDAWILADDEQALRAPARPAAAPARLLPSGDTYFLLQGADRELLVPEADRRRLLWTPRVWPGAVLVSGEIVGTWRRAGAVVVIEPWRRLALAERNAIEAEAASLPLPGLNGPIQVRWAD